MDGDQDVGGWPVEDIPNADTLFLRVHHANVRNGRPIPRAYNEHEGGMSTNWSRYADAELTRQQAALIVHAVTGRPKNPANYGVLHFGVGAVREIEDVEVIHTPRIENRAHTDVTGTNSPEARVKLGRIGDWAIPI
jgi:hypothetical protein